MKYKLPLSGNLKKNQCKLISLIYGFLQLDVSCIICFICLLCVVSFASCTERNSAGYHSIAFQAHTCCGASWCAVTVVFTGYSEWGKKSLAFCELLGID